MNSPPNNKSEQSLNIDDSDLRPTVVFRPYNNHHKCRQTTTTTQTLVSSQNPKFDNCAEKLFRIIPCPAGIVQATKLCKITDIREGGQEGIVSGCSGGINFFCNNGKLDKVVAVVKSSTSNALGDLTVTLTNPSSVIFDTINHKVLTYGGFRKAITIGVALILHNVSMFSPKQSTHYLNIAMQFWLMYSTRMVDLQLGNNAARQKQILI
ncbi:hypothetical protein Tco_0757973 [Tanacetum coccineum]